MKDHSFVKLGEFYINVNHVKEVEDSILPSKLTFEAINFRKKHEIKMKRFMLIGEICVEIDAKLKDLGLLYSFAAQPN